MSDQPRTVKKAVTIWVGEELLAQLQKEAASQDRSRNYVVEKMLSDRFLPKSVGYIPATRRKGK